MKYKIIAFIDGLIVYDFILFGAIILLFILFLILAIALSKHTTTSVLLILFSLVFVFITPVFGYKQMHAYLFKNSIEILQTQKLEFSDAILVSGILNNESKKRFSSCKIRAGVYKVSHNIVLDMIYPINPFKKTTHNVDLNLSSGEEYHFKFFIEPFYYSKDYNISVKGYCK